MSKHISTRLRPCRHRLRCRRAGQRAAARPGGLIDASRPDEAKALDRQVRLVAGRQRPSGQRARPGRGVSLLREGGHLRIVASPKP
jgi:hypothetical protein